MDAGIAPTAKVAIAGGLVVLGRGLVLVRGLAVFVGRALVAVGLRLVGVGQGLIAVAGGLGVRPPADCGTVAVIRIAIRPVGRLRGNLVAVGISHVDLRYLSGESDAPRAV
jgi:hypothetical protein